MTKKVNKKEYRLKGAKYTIVVEGLKKHYKKGDLVPLTATQAVAFKDQFEDPNAEAKRAQLQKNVDAKAKTDAKESEDAKKRRAEELEDRKEADRKAAQEKIAADKDKADEEEKEEKEEEEEENTTKSSKSFFSKKDPRPSDDSKGNV